MIMALSLALISVALMAVSQLTFKAASLRCTSGIAGMRSQPAVLFGLGLNGIAAVLWLLPLSRLDLSYAAPILSLTYLLVPFGAFFLFRETVSRQRVAAILVICAGVLVCLWSRG